MERIPLLFDKMIKPEWFDFALERFLSSDSEDALRTELRDWLKSEDLSQVSIDKTIRVLQKVVGFRSTLTKSELQELYNRLNQLTPDERAHERLQMLIQNNAFFSDCVQCIRRRALNGATFITVMEMYEALQKQYGYRQSVTRRIRYVLQTLAAFGCLENRDRVWHFKDDSPLL